MPCHPVWGAVEAKPTVAALVDHFQSWCIGAQINLYMKRFIFVSFLFLAIASHVHLHGQGAVPATRGTATQAPAVISTIQFKEQSSERQQYILANPEQFRVLENGTVEVLALPSMNLVPETPAPSEQTNAPAQAEDARPRAVPETPKQISAVEILSLPPAVQWQILEHQEEHEITKSILTQAAYDRLRPDQQKTIEANPNLFTIKQ